MNCLAISVGTQVIAALVDGTSINATCRMTGAAKHTALKLLKDMGCACAAYHNARVRNLRMRPIQADEIWAFVYGKDKNLTMEQVKPGADIDYAMLVKTYGASSESPESRYSPATCIGCRTGILAGDPDPKRTSTSYVERSNLSMRMGMRRFTRLTNGFSKEVENHGHMVALYFMHYGSLQYVERVLRNDVEGGDESEAQGKPDAKRKGP
jgi:hypothetical protein